MDREDASGVSEQRRDKQIEFAIEEEEEEDEGKEEEKDLD